MVLFKSYAIIYLAIGTAIYEVLFVPYSLIFRGLAKFCSETDFHG